MFILKIIFNTQVIKNKYFVYINLDVSYYKSNMFLDSLIKNIFPLTKLNVELYHYEFDKNYNKIIKEKIMVQR